jgi:hypothetical protein
LIFELKTQFKFRKKNLEHSSHFSPKALTSAQAITSLFLSIPCQPSEHHPADVAHSDPACLPAYAAHSVCSPSHLPPRSPEPPSAWPAPPCHAPPWGALPCSTVEEVKDHPYLLYSPSSSSAESTPPLPLLFDFVMEAIEATLTDGRCSPSPTPHLTTVTL